MPELTLDEKLRTAHVVRWQIVNVGRSQSVAEHSFLVQVLAIHIARAIKWSNKRGGPINVEKEYNIMRWAMWHDMMEVKTGDINTPVKIFLRQVAGDDVISRVEYSYSEEYEKISKEVGDTVKDIVKLADYMEALNFLSEEGKGKHADQVADGIRVAMRSHFDVFKRKTMSLSWKNIEPLVMSL